MPSLFLLAQPWNTLFKEGQLFLSLIFNRIRVFFQIKKESSHIGLKMISGVQSYVYFHIKKDEEMWYNRILRCVHWKNSNVWNAVYRISTERVLIKELREWDNTAWWERHNPKWQKREDWHTMISVVDKLVKKGYNCLEAICFIFMLENLILKFHKKSTRWNWQKNRKKPVNQKKHTS